METTGVSYTSAWKTGSDGKRLSYLSKRVDHCCWEELPCQNEQAEFEFLCLLDVSVLRKVEPLSWFWI